LPAADKARLDDKDDVLNGIAWNAGKGTFYVTGKRWPKLFEIKVKLIPYGR
jgi:glutamine cyclotransferase